MIYESHGYNIFAQWSMTTMVTKIILSDIWQPWLQNVSSMIYDNHGYNLYLLSSMVYEDHGLSIYLFSSMIYDNHGYTVYLYLMNNMHMSQLWQGVGTSKVCKTAQQQNKQQRTKLYGCTQPGVFFSENIY